MTKQEIMTLQKDFEELKAILIKESFKQLDENSSSSQLDLSDNMSAKNKLRKGVSSEFFFGDPLINYIEQTFNETSILSPDSKASSKEITNFREWSLQSLKAKHTYLTSLKTTQQKYAESLLTDTFKYLPREKHYQVQQYAKVYLQNELGKNDLISGRLWEAFKKFDESPMSSPIMKDDKTGNEELEITDKKTYYEQILQKIEKKYDEVSKLAMQNLSKNREPTFGGDSSVTNESQFDSLA
jgi:hypothetical protein